MSRQIFGYTKAFGGGPYVEFIAATTTDTGGVLISVRNQKGEYNTIALPPEDARDLGRALLGEL